MTIEEAEQFYKRYDGLGFHMWREEPERAEAFKALHISPEIKTKWDDDLIRQAFKMLWDKREKTWWVHSRLIKLIGRNPREEYIDRFLSEMEKMKTLDKWSKVIIIENMAGRDRALTGGCRLICKESGQAERMDRIMRELMDFACTEDDATGELGWTDPADRYRNAVSAYRAACQKWR
ncbi:MAG: hypothetical protein IJJ43_01550 [Oscillospiraceae bacterium]|nr:hypothetical protein [Oscillospiraceae bacterium]